MSLASLLGAFIIWGIGGFEGDWFEIERKNKYSVFVGLLFIVIILGVIYLFSPLFE